MKETRIIGKPKETVSLRKIDKRPVGPRECDRWARRCFVRILRDVNIAAECPPECRFDERARIGRNDQLRLLKATTRLARRATFSSTVEIRLCVKLPD